MLRSLPLIMLVLVACGPKGVGGSGSGGEGGTAAQSSGGQGAGGQGAVDPYPSDPVPAPFDGDFDLPASGEYKAGYRVVGELKTPPWSWGQIELLEGFQAYRTEGYNLRTQKLRWQDT